MYLEHFGLSTRPFGITPRLDFLYRSRSFEEGFAHLIYGLECCEPIVMITGAIGTGKTMAIQSFLSLLGDRSLSALVTNTHVDGKELLKLILEDLGVPALQGADKSDLLIAFKNLLIDASKQGKRIVVIVDEAQNLSREALEEIRLLTNMGQGDDQPVQIILVGQPELEATILRPDLAQLKQRIRVSCKLTPLSRPELEEYVEHRMAVAGAAPGLFHKEALDRIYTLSGGVPREINTLCSEALLSAYVAGRSAVAFEDLDGGKNISQAEVPPPPPLSRVSARPANDPRPASGANMAVRRESVTESPGLPKEDKSIAPPTSAHRPSRRGLNTAIAAIIGASIVVFLISSGQFEKLSVRLLPARKQGAAAASRAVPPNPDSTIGLHNDFSEATLATSDSVRPSARSDSLLSPYVGRDIAALPARVVSRVVESTSPNAPIDSTKTPKAVAGPPSVPADGVPSSPATPDMSYFVHVSAFSTAESARAVVNTYTKAGMAATVHEQSVGGKMWYRVYIGPFGSHSEAVRLANRLREEGSITYYKVIQLVADAGQ